MEQKMTIPDEMVNKIQGKLREEFKDLVDDLRKSRDEWKKKYYDEFHKNGILMKDVNALKRTIQIVKENSENEKPEIQKQNIQS